jgi:hypothetical protein
MPSPSGVGYAVRIAVSPLDARTVFVTLERTELGPGCTPAPATGLAEDQPALAADDALLSSGPPICAYQTYISHDGGAHWLHVSLPVGGVIDTDVTQTAASLYPLALWAQGGRLYATLDPVTNEATSWQMRLITNSGGGATWQSAVDPLLDQVGQVEHALTYLPASNGPTIAALAMPALTPVGGPLVLWLTQDGGNSWSPVGLQVGTPYYVQALAVGAPAAGHALYLYILGAGLRLTDDPARQPGRRQYLDGGTGRGLPGATAHSFPRHAGRWLARGIRCERHHQPDVRPLRLEAWRCHVAPGGAAALESCGRVPGSAGRAGQRSLPAGHHERRWHGCHRLALPAELARRL